MATILYVLGGLCSLGGMGLAIFILIYAFKESIGQGFLSLCVPFYILYYGFARMNHPKRAMVTGLYLGLVILGAVLMNVAAMMMVKDMGGLPQ